MNTDVIEPGQTESSRRLSNLIYDRDTNKEEGENV